jgi:hypothetical protein
MRFIGQNIRLVQDVLEHARTTKKGGILLFLDFEKAFDSLEWTFMIKSLRKFNFGNDFIRWILTLYNDPNLCIKNNGHISGEINITRGIKQGCPLSALLFIVAVEILSLRVKQNSDIKGYKVQINNNNNHNNNNNNNSNNSILELKLSQYADDGTMFLHDENQIPKTIGTINEFGLVSGLRLNINKSIGLYLGNNNDLKELVISGIRLTNKPQKCLGVYVGYDKQFCEQMNWTSKLIVMENLLDTWSQRDLTIFGKITIIKTLAVPKLTHVASNCTIPEGFVQKVNRMFYNFIWGKRDRIKRNVLIAPIERGGVGMIDIESYLMSLKACWIARLFDDTQIHSNWNVLAKTIIDLVIPHETIQYFSFDREEMFPHIKNLHAFYREVIIAFSKSNEVKKPQNITDFLNLNLWGNRQIVY